MAELFSSTLKYFHLAIQEFLPDLESLLVEVQDRNSQEDIEDLIEAYKDIDAKIEGFNLNYDDPNRFYDGEPTEIDIRLSDEMIKNLVMLSHRLLVKWKVRFNRLNKKKYFTEANKNEIMQLRHLIRPLEALMKESSYELGKYGNLGPLIFPGELTDKVSSAQLIRTIKNRLKVNDLFVESRTQGEDQHILIGKRDGTAEKAHLIIDGKTGEIRVEDNQLEPTGLIQKIEAILTLPDGKMVRVTRESIEELTSE